MAKQTLREQYKEALIKSGWRVAEKQTSKKYLAMEKHDSAGKIFLGKSGAMRYGRISSDSIPVLNKQRFLG